MRSRDGDSSLQTISTGLRAKKWGKGGGVDGEVGGGVEIKQNQNKKEEGNMN